MATPKLSVSLIAVGIAGVILILLGHFITSGAEDAVKNSSKAQKKKAETEEQVTPPAEEKLSSIRMFVGNEKFWVNIDLGDAAQEFARAVPFGLDMEDKDGVAKIYCGEDKLPTKDIYKPDHIRAGEIMLYNDNCIEIFYKDVDTEESFVKLGNINDYERLPKILDDGKTVTLQFGKQ